MHGQKNIKLCVCMCVCVCVCVYIYIYIYTYIYIYIYISVQLLWANPASKDLYEILERFTLEVLILKCKEIKGPR